MTEISQMETWPGSTDPGDLEGQVAVRTTGQSDVDVVIIGGTAGDTYTLVGWLASTSRWVPIGDMIIESDIDTTYGRWTPGSYHRYWGVYRRDGSGTPDSIMICMDRR